jgi:hypothetical protein
LSESPNPFIHRTYLLRGRINPDNAIVPSITTKVIQRAADVAESVSHSKKLGDGIRTRGLNLLGVFPALRIVHLVVIVDWGLAIWFLVCYCNYDYNSEDSKGIRKAGDFHGKMEVEDKRV